MGTSLAPTAITPTFLPPVPIPTPANPTRPTQSLIAVKGGVSQPSHAIAHEVETSPETCNCVAASENGQLMAAAFGKTVRIYASNPSGLYPLADVRVSL